ncbi:MAG: hypothetical protein ACRD6W_13760, partial [Nitrososphaerales archaeon]
MEPTDMTAFIADMYDTLGETYRRRQGRREARQPFERAREGYRARVVPAPPTGAGAAGPSCARRPRTQRGARRFADRYRRLGACLSTAGGTERTSPTPSSPPAAPSATAHTTYLRVSVRELDGLVPEPGE